MKRFITSFLFIFFIICIVHADHITSGSVYRISTMYTGNRTLMVENSSLDNSTKVSVWTETGTNSQRWRISDAGDGAYYIDNVYSEKRLFRSASTSIVQASQNTSDAYCWILTPVEESGYENCFYISNKTNPAPVLELTSGGLSDADGTPVRMAEKSGEKEARQIWKIEQAEDIPNSLSPAMLESMMQAWENRYFDELKNSTGFWGYAEIMEIILDAYETTAREEYKTLFETFYTNFVSGTNGGWGQHNSQNWAWNEFNDDIAWGVLASIRAYLMFGNSLSGKGINYLSIAQRNFDLMYSRARYKVDDLYYLLRWKEGQEGTTSCVNGPAEVAACYLAMAMEINGNPTKAEDYYEKAKELYLNQRKHMYNPKDGRVYDTFSSSWASPYNQGTYLGAAVMLYNRCGDEMFKSDAEKIIEFARTDFCNSQGIITSCTNNDGDLSNFRGILPRYLRRFIEDIGTGKYGEWLQMNAIQAYNNRNSAGLSHIDWTKKTEEKSEDFGSAPTFAAVAAAVNAPMDINTIYKSAFSTIQAGSFNYVSKVSAQNNQFGENMEVVDIEKGAYLGYNFVQFKNRLATGIELQLANDDKERKVEIRLGSSTGELIATIVIPASDGNYTTVSGVFEKPMDGTENVYLVFTGDKNGLKFKSFKFTGAADALIFSDLTNAGQGVLTSSHNAKDLELVIDDRLSTKALVTCKASEQVWIQYEMINPVVLSAYALASANGNASTDPKAWKLQASNNGTDWTELDTQTAQTFENRNQLKKYTLSNTNTYQYFRLAITERNGNLAELQLGEWQLYGSALAADDITSDGGTLSAQYAGNGDNEKYTKLTDNDINTKYLVKDQSDIWIQYAAKARYKLTSYSLSSANDEQGRDPESWTLYGSENGTDWSAIDSQSEQMFALRNSTQIYSCTPDVAYSYFKLHITGNNGDSHTQIAEWQLFGELVHDFYFHDFTKSGGRLTSSSDVDGDNTSLTALTDNNAETYYSLDASSLPVWIQYESTVPVQLQGYSVTPYGMDSRYDPKSWQLQASTNGVNWTNLDSRSNETFEMRYGKKDYEKSNSTKYTYFRLQITAANSDEVRIGEWQIYGKYLNVYDATSNAGGSINAQWPGNYELNDAGSIKTDERIAKLIDNKDTKYCVNGRISFWATYQSKRPMRLKAYSLMSANDNADRDPKKWSLSGSTNGTTWTVIDERDNQAFPYYNSTLYYPVVTDERYSYFKLAVAENQGVKTIQLSEWQLFGEFNEYAEDITENGGTLTSSRDAADGTTLAALIDNDEANKYYVDITNTQWKENGGLWFAYESPVAVHPTSYSLTSSNDNPNNDPKSWTLQASNDDVNWTDIDARENIEFESRCERKVFEFSGAAAYKYFRLHITERKSTAKGFQLAEWELFGTPSTGIYSPSEEHVLGISPNPAIDYIMINVTEESILNIYNLNGVLLHTQELQCGNASVDVKNYSQGVYVVKLKSAGLVKTSLLMKK